MSNIVLTLKRIDSMVDLIETLRQSKTKNVLLGQKAQQSKEFILILVKNVYTGVELLRIGVICEGHGMRPQCAISESEDIIVGFNQEICLMSLDSLDMVLRRDLDSLFYEFRIIKELNLIMVVCETEIYCLSQALEIVWSDSLDLIVDHEITDEYVRVTTDDETRVYLILDGHRAHKS